MINILVASDLAISSLLLKNWKLDLLLTIQSTESCHEKREGIFAFRGIAHET